MRIFVDTITTTYLKKDDLVIDIETTGVHRDLSKILIVGLLSGDQKNNFKQILASESYDNITDERELLENLKPLLEEKNIISYNGKNFDLPFIFARMKFHHIEPPEIKGHFDVYNYFLENRFFFKSPGFSLQSMEGLVGIERFEEFEKDSDLDFYDELEDFRLAQIALHNKYDVINTEKLLSFVNKLKADRTFEISIKDKKISLYLKGISLNKNLVRLNFESRSIDQDQRFESSDSSLYWKKSKLKIYFQVHEGYVAPNTLGYVHIQKRKPLLIDQSDFKLSQGLLVIYQDKQFNLPNIKKLSDKIITYFIN